MIRVSVAIAFMATGASADTLQVPAIILCETQEELVKITTKGPSAATDCDILPPISGVAWSFDNAQAFVLREMSAPGWCSAGPAIIHAMAWTHNKTGEPKTAFVMTCEPLKTQADTNYEL